MPKTMIGAVLPVVRTAGDPQPAEVASAAALRYPEAGRSLLGHGLLTVPRLRTAGLPVVEGGRPAVGPGARSGDRAPTTHQAPAPMSHPVELRNEDARHYLLQGLRLQRVRRPAADSVRIALEWCLEIASAGDPLPPV